MLLIIIISLSGLYTHTLTEAEVTQPRRVDSTGQHLSHHTTFFHDGGSETVHYNLTVNNVSRFLVLRPTQDFLIPHLVVERRRRGIHTRGKLRDELHRCHYVGEVHGEENSKVVMSSCNGLVSKLSNLKKNWTVSSL